MEQHTCYRCERTATDLVFVAAANDRDSGRWIELWACERYGDCFREWAQRRRASVVAPPGRAAAA